MKNIFAIVFILLIMSFAHGQNFEGKITYQTTYKSKTPAMKDEQFSSGMGTTQEYYIKGGNYKAITNGNILKWQLFINKDNKLYNKMSNSEALLWNDVSDYPDSVLKIQLNKGVTTILGYPCDELIMTSKAGVQKYYFNSKLGVATKLFAKHKYGNWYVYLKTANALPLKMIIDDQQFNFVSVATEVKPMTLDDKFFQLPEHAKTEKSPY